MAHESGSKAIMDAIERASSSTITRVDSIEVSCRDDPGAPGCVRVGIAGALVCTLALLGGCSSAPSRNILGSYFPSWMICALVGMSATVAVRALLVKAGIDGEVPMPVVVYLAMATAFSLAVWLMWLG